MNITLHIPDLTDWVSLLSVIAGVLGVIDGVARTRGSRLLGIIEIVVSALVLAAIFLDFHVNAVPVTTLAIILLIVLVVGLFVRGGVRRGGISITILALIATALLLLEAFGWLHLPGLKG